ncbi:hypothetical protein AX17_001490 [Amanita inopinata Kibby_2008]|nr:hypothetical protein AX17_001490 [Amanita inopinata Kibby_2008]
MFGTSVLSHKFRRNSLSVTTSPTSPRNSEPAIQEAGSTVQPSILRSWAQVLTGFLFRWGTETHGVTPVQAEYRTDTRLYQLFFAWFSSNFNILTFSTGSAGPIFFKLGLRDSLLILLFVDLVVFAMPAYMAVFGPKLGMRSMVQARYSWGYYAVMVPSTLNVISMQGFFIVNCIIGGQTLASVSNKLDATLGIVIIGVLSLAICSCGYRVVHRFESLSWIPNLIIFPIVLGVGGRHLNPSHFVRSEPSVPKASSVMSFLTLIASSNISWCTMTADYGVYHDARASSCRIFSYTYLGFLLASIPMHMLGTAFAAAATSVPSWEEGLKSGIGGLLSAILFPIGGFGKVLVVILSLGVTSASALMMYSVTTSSMSIAPVFARIPRFVYILISEAILIPVAIIGESRFFPVLVYIMSAIGYWTSAFAAIVLVEHIVFRGRCFENYVQGDYDQPCRLPSGWAAIVAILAAAGIIVPSISHSWYTGPIARMGTGDIGVLVGFIVAGLTYAPLRWLERRLRGRPECGATELKVDVVQCRA